MTDEIGVWRRHVLTALALAVPAAAIRPAFGQTAPPSAGRAFSWLQPDEAAALEAMAARLIPADDLGPGAKEADVATFIDRQMAGPWGAGAQLYRAGPFQVGTPQQGYQFPFTPADMLREGFKSLDARMRADHGGRGFADLPADVQDVVLTALEAGKMELESVPAAGFFATVLDLVIEGFFADPVYGGNKGMAGWKLVGFPGAYGSYAQDIERHGLAYGRAPVSLAEAPEHPHPDMAHAHGGRG